MGADAGDAALDPVDQQTNPIGPTVAVDAVEFRRAGNPETVGAEAAGDQLGGIVEQTDRGRGSLAEGIVEVDRDRLPFHRIDVDAVAQAFGEASAVRWQPTFPSPLSDELR